MESTVEVYKVHLEAFLKVATAASSSAMVGSYGASTSATGPVKQTSLTSFSLKELTVSPIYTFVNIPSCRTAALQFFATLIREHVALYLASIENPGQVMDYGVIEEALNEIDQAMQHDLRERDGQWCLLLFEWSLETLAEISKKNANRRAFAGLGGHGNASGDGGLGDVLQTYSSCRSTRLLLESLNECVGRLLMSSPEQCIASLLETAARFGSFCDWILTFIGMKYPKTIIDHLLTIGASDFNTYITEMMGKQSSMNVKQIVSKQDQYHREKLISLSSILGHLAHQQGVELRRQLSAVIQDGLVPNASQRQQYSLVFVIKAASLSRDVADLLLQDLHYMVTADNIATISRIFGQIPQVIMFGEQNPAHLLINVIMALKESTLSLLYDKLLHLAFDELNFERHDPRTNVFMIQKYALSVLEVLMTNMERHVHNNKNFPPESTPLLNEIEKNLPLALKRLFSSNEMQRNYYFKCLNLLCFVRGESKTMEILANILFHATNEQQLSLFICFCRILHPVHQQSVQRLFVKLPEYFEKYRTSDGNEWTWVKNVKNLLRWDQVNMVNKETNIMNLTEIFLNNYSEIVDYLLPLIGMSPTINRTVVEILTKIGQPVHQSPQAVLRVVTACCSLIFETFADIDTPEGMELNKAFAEYLVMFVQSQPSYAIEIALRTLLARVIRPEQRASRGILALFGLSSENAGLNDDGTDASARVIAKTGESTFSPDSTPLLVGNQKLNGLRKSTVDENAGSFTSLDLVHSGVIQRRIPPGQRNQDEQAISNKAILCKLAFVRLFDRLCSGGRPSTTGNSTTTPSSAPISNNYSLDVCRVLACLLTEYLCPDAIAADHSWEDWEVAKNSIERFLATAKRIEEIPFAWDLLNIVSEVYPCLWFCAPLVKSLLATAIVQGENTIDKTVKVAPRILKLLDNLFLILYKGRLLTEPLTYVIDLLPHLNQFEAASVLGSIWRYFQTVTPDSKSLEHHFECIQCNFGSSLEPVKGDHAQYLDTILLVIQSNVASTGYLLDKFVNLSDSEPMDSCN